MGSTLQFSQLDHAIHQSSDLIYKTCLYNLTDLCAASTYSELYSSNQNAFCLTCSIPLDLYKLFSEAYFQKIAYFSHYPLSLFISRRGDCWIYAFYTTPTAPFYFIEKIANLLERVYPHCSVEWICTTTLFDQDFVELAMLSTLPPLSNPSSPVGSFHLDSFTLLILITPLTFPTLLTTYTEIQMLYHTLFPFKDIAYSNTCTQTGATADTSNHAHGQNETTTQSNSDGISDTETKNETTTNNGSLNYKINEQATLYYSISENLFTGVTNNQTSNTSMSSSNQASCNYSTNSSKSCTDTHTCVTTTKDFNIQVDQILKDCSALLDYFIQIRSLATYEIAFYFLSTTPLDATLSATLYATCINPTPSVVYPQIINTFSVNSDLFRPSLVSLQNAYHPMFCSYDTLPLIAPTLIGADQQLPALFIPLLDQ